MLIDQMIGAYLRQNGKHIHLRGGNSNVAKDIAQITIDFIITVEKGLDALSELLVRAELRVKNRMSADLFVHVVMRAVHVFEPPRLRSKVGDPGCEVLRSQRRRFRIRSLEAQLP